MVRYQMLSKGMGAGLIADLSRKLQLEEGWPPVIDSPEVALEKAQQDVSSPQQFFFIAWQDDPAEVVGFLGLEFLEASLLGPYVDVGRFYVAPAWRNKRIGWKLLEYAVKTLPEMSDRPVLCLTVDGSDAPARAYRRMGFEPVGTLYSIPYSNLRKNFIGQKRPRDPAGPAQL